MSQETRNKQSGNRDIQGISNKIGQRKDYEGFEGMNFEQVRKPYNPNHTDRNNNSDERMDGKRPDEA